MKESYHKNPQRKKESPESRERAKKKWKKKGRELDHKEKGVWEQRVKLTDKGREKATGKNKNMPDARGILLGGESSDKKKKKEEEKKDGNERETQRLVGKERRPKGEAEIILDDCPASTVG